jgi:hypothetical protein
MVEKTKPEILLFECEHGRAEMLAMRVKLQGVAT